MYWRNIISERRPTFDFIGAPGGGGWVRGRRRPSGERSWRRAHHRSRSRRLRSRPVELNDEIWWPSRIGDDHESLPVGAHIIIRVSADHVRGMEERCPDANREWHGGVELRRHQLIALPVIQLPPIPPPGGITAATA